MPISEVYNMDCVVGMKSYPDKFFDLAIVDPPYGIDGNSHRKNKSRGRLAKSKNYHMALWDQHVPNDEYFIELFRVSKHQLIFGGNYFKQLGEPFKTPRRDQINEWLRLYKKGWVAWDKCNGTTGFNDYELIWTSFKRMASFIYMYMWNGFMQGRSPEKGHEMNPFKKQNEIRIHPAHKPVNLYKYLLTEFGQSRKKILDTHMGSQSSRIAAHEMGFDYYGYELDKQYFADGSKRFKELTAQIQMFK